MPTAELPPSTIASTFSASTHRRTMDTPMSGLFWLSANTTSIFLPIVDTMPSRPIRYAEYLVIFWLLLS